MQQPSKLAITRKIIGSKPNKHHVARLKMLGKGKSTTDGRVSVYDGHATPKIVIEELLAREEFSDFIWEPAAGLLDLVNVIEDHDYEVFASDIFRWHEEIDCKRDFMKFDTTPYDEACDIITNPPFKWAKLFLLHSLKLLRPGCKLALLLPTRYLEGQWRGDLFNKYPPETVYIFSYRVPRMHRFFWKGKKSESNVMSFAWFVWRCPKDRKWSSAPATVIEWIRKNDLVTHPGKSRSIT